VVSVTPPVRYQQSIQNIEDLLEQGHQSRLEILSSERLHEVLAFGGKPSVKVTAVRYARKDTRPLALVAVQLVVQDEAQACALLDKERAARGIVDALQANRIGRIEQSLQAVNLSESEAQALGVSIGAAALKTDRHYYDATGEGELMVVANSLYRGDLYPYRSTLRRG